MGFYKEMGISLGDLTALEEAVEETEEEIRLFGHAYAGPAIRSCWQLYDNIRKRMEFFGPALPPEKMVRERLEELRGRVSSLG